MPVELWIAKELDTYYEREALDRFMTDMEAYFGQSDTLYLVLADYVIDGRQVNLTVLKHDAITIIELKECADPFEAFENQRWLTTNGRTLGSRGLNPFQQVKQYRIKWFDVLKRNRHSFRCLANTHDDRPFWQARALVTVSPALHPKTKNHISSKHNFWFKLCGLDELARQVSFETSKWLNFSDDELHYLASDLLTLRQRSWPLPVEAELSSLQETGIEVQEKGDIHKLDKNVDGAACESLP